MMIGNLSTFLYSLDMEEYMISLPYFSPAVSIVANLSIGFLSDRVAHVFPRYWFVVIVFIGNIFCYCLAIFYLDNLYVMILNLTFWNLGGSVINCCMGSLLIIEFGLRSFSRLWGLMFFGTSV